MEQHSVLDLIKQFGTDTNLYKGHSVKELKAYCKELGIKGYSSWNKPKLVRELASLADLELNMFAGAEVVVEQIEVVTEEVVVSEDEAKEAEKDEPTAAVCIAKANQLVAEGTRRSLAAAKCWVAKAHELQGTAKPGELAAAKAAFLATLDEPNKAVHPVRPEKEPVENGLITRIRDALDEKGISYHEEGDTLILNEDARIVISNHAKGLTQTFKRWLRPVIWGRAGWVVSTVFKVG